MPPEIHLVQTIVAGGPALMLVAAIVFLWRYIAQKDAESLERGRSRDERITHLESKQDAHAEQYRALAEKIADVIGQNKDVLERVLEKLR